MSFTKYNPYISPHHNPLLLDQRIVNYGFAGDSKNPDLGIPKTTEKMYGIRADNSVFTYPLRLNNAYSLTKIPNYVNMQEPTGELLDGTYDYAGVDYPAGTYRVDMGYGDTYLDSKYSFYSIKTQKNLLLTKQFNNSTDISSVTFTNFLGKKFTFYLTIIGKFEGTIRLYTPKSISISYYYVTNPQNFPKTDFDLLLEYENTDAEKSFHQVYATKTLNQTDPPILSVFQENDFTTAPQEINLLHKEGIEDLNAILVPDALPSGWTANPHSEKDWKVDRRFTNNSDWGTIGFSNGSDKVSGDVTLDGTIGYYVKYPQLKRINRYYLSHDFSWTYEDLYPEVYNSGTNTYYITSHQPIMVRDEDGFVSEFKDQKNTPTATMRRVSSPALGNNFSFAGGPDNVWYTGNPGDAVEWDWYYTDTRFNFWGDFRNIRVWYRYVQAPVGVDYMWIQVRTGVNGERYDVESESILLDTLSITPSPNWQFIDFNNCNDSGVTSTREKLKYFSINFKANATGYYGENRTAGNLDVVIACSPTITPLPHDILLADKKIPGGYRSSSCEQLVTSSGVCSANQTKLTEVASLPQTVTNSERFQQYKITNDTYTGIATISDSTSGYSQLQFCHADSYELIDRRSSESNNLFPFLAVKDIPIFNRCSIDISGAPNIILNEIEANPTVLTVSPSAYVFVGTGQLCGFREYLFKVENLDVEKKYTIEIKLPDNPTIGFSERIQVDASHTDLFARENKLFSKRNSFYMLDDFSVQAYTNAPSATCFGMVDISGASAAISGHSGEFFLAEKITDSGETNIQYFDAEDLFNENVWMFVNNHSDYLWQRVGKNSWSKVKKENLPKLIDYTFTPLATTLYLRIYAVKGFTSTYLASNQIKISEVT